MVAAACLQVVVTPATAAAYGADILNIVAKVTNAYLDSRWSWPRKFGVISKTSYVLADPRAAELDPHEIKQLSAELQLRLFGAGETGDVTLAVFEGSKEDSLRFGRLETDDLRRLLSGADMESLGLSGRLIKVSAHAVEIVADATLPDAKIEALAQPPAGAAMQKRLLYRGLYLAPKKQFIGSVLSRWSPEDKRQQSILEGPSHYPADPETFDRETLEALISSFPDPSIISGQILLPLNYTMMTRRTAREHYIEFLAPLAKWPRERLTAVLYDAPRMVQNYALNEIRAVLKPYFENLDFCVADPGVELAALEPGVLSSVSLALSSADEDLKREANIKRFMSNREVFRERHIFPMISNIRTRRELQICATLRAPLLYGPAVTGVLTEAVGMTPFLPEGLPVNAKAA